MEEKSNDASITIGGETFGVTLTKSTAKTEDGVTITSFGIQFGLGSSGFSVGKGNTPQMQGAKGSKEKEKQRDQYKEQQQQKKEEIGNSLWNWLSK